MKKTNLILTTGLLALVNDGAYQTIRSALNDAEIIVPASVTLAEAEKTQADAQKLKAQKAIKAIPT